METDHTRRLLASIQALATVDTDQGDALGAFLPDGYLDFYSAGEQCAFGGDPFDIFSVAIEDYFWEYEDAIKAESPVARDLLEEELSILFEPSEPWLHTNDPAAWQAYRRGLLDFTEKLRAVLDSN